VLPFTQKRNFAMHMPREAVPKTIFDQFGTFKAQDIEFRKKHVLKPKPDNSKDYIFGRVSTDHMLTLDWDHKDGWAHPVIEPYGPLSIPVSATSLHYGLSCYEGMNIV